MKNTMKCLGVIAIVAVIGFSFAACEEPILDDTPALNSITAEYVPTAAVFPDTEIDALKADLTVTAYYDNGDEKELDAKDYDLSGTLAVGTSDITVTYRDKATDFTVTVSAEPHNDITYTAMQAGGIDEIITTTGIVFTFGASVDSFDLTADDITVGGAAEKGTATFTKSGGTWRLSPITVNEAGNATVSINKPGIEAETKHVMVYREGEAAPILIGITAVYTQGETIIYPTPTTQIDELKARLTVKAQYNNGKEFRLSAGEYTLDGTLTVGTSTVTVSYENKTAGFTVNVTPAPEYWNITWHLDGGTPGTGAYPAHIVKGEVLAKPSPNPSMADNIFIGWYSDLALEHQYNFDDPVIANLSLYANWVRKSNTTLREVTIDMFDSAPDGWDGDAALTIFVNGEQIATGVKVHTNGAYNIPSGQTGSNTYTFLVNLGDEIELYWGAGQYQEENSFIAYYTDTPPVPAFTAGNNNIWNGDNALVYKLRGTLKNTSSGTSMGTFINVTAPTITTSSLPVGTVGTTYSYTLTATGDAPITWELESGALPDGLTLSTEGVISGNPAAAGVLSFTVTATNNVGSHSRQLSITVMTSGASMEEAIELTENIWADGNLPTGGSVQWFTFTATASTQYIHAAFGTLTSLQRQVYDSSGTEVGAEATGTGSISRTLTVGETYYIRVRPYSSYIGNYQIAFNTSSGTVPLVHLPPDAIQLTANQWADGSLPTSNDYQWFTFNATVSTQFIHMEPGTLTQVYVNVYDSSGARVESETSLYSTSRSVLKTLEPGQTYYIRVRPSYNTVSGTYRIGFTASIVPPGGAIPLTENQLANGSLPTSISQQWFVFTATASTQYIHMEPGTLTICYVNVYDGSSTVVGSESQVGALGTSRSLTPGDTYYIRIRPFDYSGDYRIAFNASFESPSINYIPLTANQWADGDIPTSNDRQWFKFTATASTQIVHIALGTLTNLYVNVYDSSGAVLGSESNLYSTASARSVSKTLTPGQTYYIRVRPYTLNNTNYSGDYRIAFNTTAYPPDINPIPLTENQWANGSIPTSNGYQWFVFTATSSSHYIHVTFGTLTDLYVQVYDSGGVEVESQTDLYGSTRYTSRTLTSGQTYYIKVRPYGSRSGTYQIGFTRSTTAPPAPIQLPSAIQLTENQWANGDLPTSSDVQWFTFTATASTQYIHFAAGTLTIIYVQMYTGSGAAVEYETSMSRSSLRISRSLTPGDTYYIKVTPYSSSYSGDYRIGFTASVVSPGSNPIPLTANQWTDGDIPTSNDVQWFVFTATATAHYIHFAANTLTQIYMQVYNSSSNATVGSSESMILSTSTNKYVSFSLSGGTTYYIRVRPYSGTGSGTYRIAFNMSAATPSDVPLTEDQWADGNVSASNGQYWKFTATASTQYIHVALGTMTQLYMQVYNSSGATVVSQSYVSSTTTISQSLTPGDAYYIRIWPYNNNGTYRIGFTASIVPPGINPIPLTENQWADGNLPTSSDEQWFTFIATASDQYIHGNFGTLAGMNVQVYDSSNATVGVSTSMSRTVLSISRSLTVGQTYYIRVRPSSSSNSGTYRIGFNTTVYPPDTSFISLTANQWTNGSLPTPSDQQWFVFTATASPQYIHAAFGTIISGTSGGIYVQVYDTSGATVGAQSRLFSTTTNISRTPTAGQTYYIRVIPYSNTYTGTYRIGFTTSTTAPTS